MSVPPLKNMLAFIHTANTGQLRSAADKMNVTESAISHQLSRLEGQLGVRLLERTHQGAKLTSAGRIFYEQINPAIDAIEHAVAGIRGNSRHRLTVTMSQSLAALWFSPRLYRLQAEIPGMEIDILPTPRVCDLKRERIDFAIRSTVRPIDDECALLLGRDEATPICNPQSAGLIREKGWQAFIDTHGVLQSALAPQEWQQWAEACDMPLPDKNKIREMVSFDLIFQVISNGLGVAMGRCPTLNTYIENGWLVKPFPDKTLISNHNYLVSAEPPPFSGIHEQFYQWLLSEMQASGSE